MSSIGGYPGAGAGAKAPERASPLKRAGAELASRRCTARRRSPAINEVLGALRLLKHPDKTFIGRIERGFDLHSRQFAALTIQGHVRVGSRLCKNSGRKSVGATIDSAMANA